MLIQERIQLIIKANNQTASEFAETVGIKRSNLSHVLSGRNKPSLDFLSKIITAYPSVNASWLITGTTREGDFKAEEPKKAVHSSTPVDKEDSIVIEKIVVFYSNGSFSEYTPSDK
jgi:transcriptional regulator with XRE-family HTH domain